MTPEQIIAGIVAIAAVLGFKEWFPGLIQQLSGRAGRARKAAQEDAARLKAERDDEIAKLRKDRDEADKEAEIQACQRRLMQEYASRLRREVITLGGEVPQYPSLTSCKENLPWL